MPGEEFSMDCRFSLDESAALDDIFRSLGRNTGWGGKGFVAGKDKTALRPKGCVTLKAVFKIYAGILPAVIYCLLQNTQPNGNNLPFFEKVIKEIEYFSFVLHNIIYGRKKIFRDHRGAAFFRKDG